MLVLRFCPLVTQASGVFPLTYVAILCFSFSGAFSLVVTVYAVSVPGCSYDRLELDPAIGTYM